MTDMNQAVLGRRIQQLRKQQGLTQEALAEALGVSPQAVSKWENDQSCPDIRTLPALARCLEVTIDLLLTGRDSSAPAPAPIKRPEELIVRIAFEEEGEVRICLNLPFIVFRHTAMHNMLTLTYTPVNGSEPVNAGEAASMLKDMDFRTIVRMIEAGATGRLLELNDDGVKLTIWTE